jgi:S1-C subfamily serine protease
VNLPFNAVDLIAGTIIVFAMIFGWRSGFIVQALALVGFVLGVVAMIALAPLATQLTAGLSGWLPGVLLVAAMAGIIVLAQVAGGALGAVIRRRVGRGVLGGLDQGAGAAFGFVRGVFLVWLIGALVGLLPIATLATEARQSLILRTLQTRLPSPLVFAGELGSVLEVAGLPDIFVGASPPPAPPLDAPGLARAEAAARGAQSSTVRVETLACGDLISGTGFAVSTGHFATNAHVVAGAEQLWVSFDGSIDRHAGRVVFFDPQLDIALIDVPRLDVAPLTFSATDPQRGDVAAALGFTGGGPERVIAALVSRTLEALTRDIYGNAITAREIIELRSSVAPGDSGGPLILADGTVGGVTFSQSRDHPDIGYALAPTAVATDISDSLTSTAAVDTGACLH